jgi:hypothetical protein
MEVHAEAQADDRSLKQKPRKVPALDVKRVRQTESVYQAAQKGERRREQTAGRQNQSNEKQPLAHVASLP